MKQNTESTLIFTSPSGVPLIIKKLHKENYGFKMVNNAPCISSKWVTRFLDSNHTHYVCQQKPLQNANSNQSFFCASHEILSIKWNKRWHFSKVSSAILLCYFFIYPNGLLQRPVL